MARENKSNILLIAYLTTCTILSVIISGCSSTSNIIILEESPPTIQSVQTIKIINGRNVATSSFRTGEKGNFIVVASDRNKDIDTLYIKGFAPGSIHPDPTIESGPVVLKPQTKQIASYSLPEPIEVPSPPGKWRVDIQVEDKENNMSNVYTLYTIIH